MKFIRDNICYVNTEDLLNEPLPKELTISEEQLNYEFVKFTKDEEKKYIFDREDIIDYDTICNLTKEKLIKKMKDIEKEVSSLSVIWLKKDDEECQNRLRILKSIYLTLKDYYRNKEQIDFKIKYIQLTTAIKDTRMGIFNVDGTCSSVFDANRFIEQFPEGGFVETFCLDNEESRIVNRLRRGKLLK